MSVAPLRSPAAFLPAVLLLTLAAACSLSAQQPAPQKEDPLHTGLPVPEGAVAVIDGTPISRARFIEEMVRNYSQPGRDGDEVRKNLLDETVVAKALIDRGLTVSDSELNEKLEWISKQVRQSGQAKDLEEYLKKNEISRTTFEQKVRSAVGLEKLTRIDFKLPDGEEVDNVAMGTWLQDFRERAKVVTDEKKLAPEVLFTVNGHPVLKERFVRDLVPSLEAKDIRKRVIDPLLQEILAERLCKIHGLSLTEADLMIEWVSRQKGFEEDPKHQGLKFEDLVRQQTGDTPEAYRSTPAFRVRAVINLLGRRVITPAQLQEGYEKYRDWFGPIFTARHILVRATENAALGKKLPSFEEARPAVERILAELRKGARFDDIARLYSEDLGTKFKGGVLPPFTPRNHRFHEAFANAAIGLEQGQLSEPVQTPEGWHIIRLDQKQPRPSLAEVEGDLRRELGRDHFLEAWKKAQVGVDARL